jgi:GAF domain-containing protein
MTERADLLGRLATIVAQGAHERPLTERLCQACRQLLDADGASITVEYETPHRVTVCATDAVAARLEDVQDVVGEGPSRDAVISGDVVVAVLDNEAEDRWPEYTTLASRVVDTGTVFAVPIRPSGSMLGVLSLYRLQPAPSPTDVDQAQFLADMVGAVLLRDPMSTSDDDSGPWSSRAVVHQATGMVVAQLGLPADDALALMRAHAFAHDVSMDELAAMVVGRQYDFRQD